MARQTEQVKFGDMEFRVLDEFLPTGDAREGGYVVYENAEGEAQLFAWEPNQPEAEYPKTYETWFDQVAGPGEVLQDLDWCDWKQVGEFVDESMDDLRRLNESSNAGDRARLYSYAAGYWGWTELDSYPEVYTAEEMATILDASYMVPEPEEEEEEEDEPSPQEVERIKRWMRRAVAGEEREYELADGINATKLAEDCANELDLCADDADATIPEWVFDAAAEVAAEVEELWEEGEEEEEETT